MIRLKLLSGLPAKTWESDAALIRLGRSPDAEVSLAGHPSRVVSEEHATITFREGWYQVADANSRNGTFVNGDALNGPRPLRDGDMLQLGADTGPQIEVSLVFDPDRWREHVMHGQGPSWGPIVALVLTTVVVLGLGAWLLLSP